MPAHGQRWRDDPGLIDCHTHLVFGGSRADEFEARLEGVSYEEIARHGGGIISTVRDTREASEDELFAAALPRLDALLADGVTTVEIKSGYGLDVENELKMLRVARRLGEARPVRVVTSLLGAHALPPEYADDSDGYIDLVCQAMIPAAADEGLADAVDVFCEKIAFSVAQCERVFEAAQAHGLPIKAHAEQLSNLGGSAMAARHGALSADHIEYLDDAGIAAMRDAGSVAVILPGAFHTLRETQQPPITGLREAGVPMAVATDANPGSSPLFMPTLMLNLACTLFRLTPREALAGMTAHGARALGFAELGRLREGAPATCVSGTSTLRRSSPMPSSPVDSVSASSPANPWRSSLMANEIDMSLWQVAATPSPTVTAGTSASRPFRRRPSGMCPSRLRQRCRRGPQPGRVGAAAGPSAIRRALAPLAWHREAPAFDAGDVTCEDDALEAAQAALAERLAPLLDAGHLHRAGRRPRDRLCQLASLARHLAPRETPPRVGIINLDAHFDLRDPGHVRSSGTPFSQIAEDCHARGWPFRYACLGISRAANTRALFQRARALDVLVREDRDVTPTRLDTIQRDLERFIAHCDRLYLTIDLDVLPACEAPGVSAPAARGVPLALLEPLIETVRDSGKLCLADIAELNPDHDIDDRTARVAARLIHLLTLNG